MPRGHAVRTPERVAEVLRLREQGLMYKDIAERMGLARSTVHEWATDPDREKHAARRMRYAGECEGCGVPTDGSGGIGRASVYCRACQHAGAYKIWTREAIVLAIQEWAETHGGIPPIAANWSPGLSRNHYGNAELSREYVENPGKWPATATVVSEMGWNEAIRAAGYEPNQPGHYGREGEDPELCAEIARRYMAGESSFALAREYGCSPRSIVYRARKAGAVIRPPTGASEDNREPLEEAA